MKAISSHRGKLSFQSRSQQLRSIDDDQLLGQLSALSEREQVLELDILLHLIEVERRKLHLDLGYRSLFQYTTEVLGYSKSSAGRRIQAARCISRFDAVALLVESGVMTMTAVCLIAKVVDETNVAEVLVQVEGCTQSEIEEVVSRYSTPMTVLERIRPVRIRSRAAGVKLQAAVATADEAGDGVGVPAAAAAADADELEGAVHNAVNRELESRADLVSSGRSRSLAGDRKPDRQVGATRSLCPGATEVPRGVSRTPAARKLPDAGRGHRVPSPSEQGYKLFLVLSARVMKKLKRAQDLVSRDTAAPATIVETMERALNEYLKDHCPTEREARRRARTKTAKGRDADRKKGVGQGQGQRRRPVPKKEKPLADRVTLRRSPTPGPSSGRVSAGRVAIPAAVRDAVFVRDGGACTYVGRHGKRCRSTYGIQIDHRIPVASGGQSTTTNLRCLCRAHNQREADRIFGEPFMKTHRGERGHLKSPLGRGCSLEEKPKPKPKPKLKPKLLPAVGVGVPPTLESAASSHDCSARKKQDSRRALSAG